jgi:hypothetical protein
VPTSDRRPNFVPRCMLIVMSGLSGRGKSAVVAEAIPDDMLALNQPVIVDALNDAEPVTGISSSCSATSSKDSVSCSRRRYWSGL